MLKDSIILTFSKGIKGILMLIFNMIIARIFSENVYGTYKQINLIVNLFSSICILGIPTTISYFYSSYDKKKKEKLIGNTIIVLSIIAIITSILLILSKNNISILLNNNDLIIYMNLIATYTLIMIISSFLENLYISSGNSVLLGSIYVIYTLCNFFGITSIIFIFKDLRYLIVGILSIEFIRILIMFILIMKKEKLNIGIDFNMAKEQIKFSIPLGVVAIVQNINGYIDNLFVSNQYAPDKYAAFANGATDIPLVGIVTVSISAVILPKISQKYNEKGDVKAILNIWGDSCEKTAIIMYPIFWIVLLFSVGYIKIIFSQKYVVDSTPIFLIYLMKFPLYCTVFGNILIVLKHQKYIMYNSIIGILLNIVLNCIFIRLIGISGPAYATVITQYVIVYLQLKKISIVCKIPITKLMPYKKLVCILSLPSIVAIPIYIFCVIFNVSSQIGLIIGGPIIYMISLMLYYKFNIIDVDIRNKFKKIVYKK